MATKAKYPWDDREVSYREWHEMDFDWQNKYKLDNCVESYFFRYNAYIKGLSNEYIIKSVFGVKSKEEIEKEIDYWFNASIGAYNNIQL